MKRVALALLGALLLSAGAFAQNFPGASGNPSTLSRPGGVFYAPAFFWQGRIISGNIATGSQTVIIAMNGTGGAGGIQLADGTTLSIDTVFNTLSPIIFDWGQGAQETVTPTAVSVITCPAGNLGVGGSMQCASVTGSFNNTHGQSGVVVDGTYGLQTAINAAQRYAGAGTMIGGMVNVDIAWQQMGGTDAIIASAVPFPDVIVQDTRRGVPQYWKPHQSVATVIAAPTTLTATTVGFGLNGANTTGGTYTGGSTYHVAVACVDLMGNESQPSADFSGLTAGSGTTNQIGIASPAAQTGCVGWVPYISLGGGSYALAYRVPVATYSAGVASANGVCILTQIETVTAACKIANTTYNQSGSNAVVSALTVNTARIWVGVGGTSTTADLVGNSNARQSYAYAPGAAPGLPGVTTSSLVFSTPTAAATTVPSVLATVAVPPAYMNFIGKKIRVCWKASQATGGTATVTTFTLVWDADGSNTTGAGVTLGNGVTGTITQTAAAASYNGCETIQTTVAGAGATAGSIKDSIGWYTLAGGVTSTSNQSGTDTSIGATASLNLAQEARLDLVYTHTTGTDGAGLIVQDLTVEDVN